MTGWSPLERHAALVETCHIQPTLARNQKVRSELSLALQSLDGVLTNRANGLHTLHKLASAISLDNVASS
jgi:hypothetical protein